MDLQIHKSKLNEVHKTLKTVCFIKKTYSNPLEVMGLLRFPVYNKIENLAYAIQDVDRELKKLGRNLSYDSVKNCFIISISDTVKKDYFRMKAKHKGIVDPKKMERFVKRQIKKHC